MAEERKALGRGLSALIGGKNISVAPTDASGVKVKKIPLENLEPGAFQPRIFFDQDALDELAASIEKNGVLQPIIVRPIDGTGRYQIIAGERRWRASGQAGLKDIPAVVESFSDKDALEIALVENIQRQSLTPVEEAEGYSRLQQEFSYTQEQLASDLGKSRSHITNMLRLLQLPTKVKDYLSAGQLTMGHARALVGNENAVELADKIIAKGLNVRQAEQFAKGYRSKARKAAKKITKNSDVRAIEQSLQKRLEMKVDLSLKGESGKLTLHFDTLEQLDQILGQLG